MNKEVWKEAAFKHRDLIMEPFEVFLDLSGFDAICAFCEQLGGQYVPSLKTVIQHCLEESARAEFQGNYRRLSRKYGLSERHLRRAISGK